MHSYMGARAPVAAGAVLARDPGVRSDDGWSRSVELTRSRR